MSCGTTHQLTLVPSVNFGPSSLTLPHWIAIGPNLKAWMNIFYANCSLCNQMAILLEATLQVASYQPKSEENHHLTTWQSSLIYKGNSPLKAVQYCGWIFLLFPSIHELQRLEKTTTKCGKCNGCFLQEGTFVLRSRVSPVWLTVCVFMLITSIHQSQPYRRVVVLSFVL